MEITPISEGTLMVEFSAVIAPEITQCIADFIVYIQQQYAPYIIEIIPSYTKVLLQYKLGTCDFEQLQQTILIWSQDYEYQQRSSIATVHHLSVYYDIEVGPDLPVLAALKHLSIEAVIEVHSRQIYDVGAIGFTPGFAFLSLVEPKIAISRHATPRQFIPAGSVGIADQQTAIYPQCSPGGWQIIGNCPQSVFEADTYPQSCFKIGDKVKFDPIERSQFLDLGGVICSAWS